MVDPVRRFSPQDCGVLFVIVGTLVASHGCTPKPPTLQTDGGYVVVYEAASDEGVDTGAMARAMRRRLDPAGARGVVVAVLDTGQYEISIPGRDADRFAQDQQVLATTGHLEFRILARKGTDDALFDATTNPNPEAARAEDPQGFWVQFEPKEKEHLTGTFQREHEEGIHEVLVVDNGFGLNGSYLQSVQSSVDGVGKPCLSGSFNAQGSRLMQAITSDHLPDPTTNTYYHLGIILDGRLITSPRIMSAVGAKFQITGRFTQAEVDVLAAVLNAGALPSPLKKTPVSVKTVDPAQ